MAKKVPEKKIASEEKIEVIQSAETGAVSEFIDASEHTMEMPGLDDVWSSEKQDKVHPKEYQMTIINRQFKQANRKAVMLDALSRALNCKVFFGNVDKPWGENPISKDRPKISVRYTREFPEKNILMDIFTADDEKTQKLIAYKRKLAHEHSYYYLVQTPMNIFTHDELTKQIKVEEESKKKEGW